MASYEQLTQFLESYFKGSRFMGIAVQPGIAGTFIMVFEREDGIRGKVSLVVSNFEITSSWGTFALSESSP